MVVTFVQFVSAWKNQKNDEREMLLNLCCETLLADATELKSQSKASRIFLLATDWLISTLGLVILEANYGSAEASETTRETTPDLSLDVTILLQALIRNSQLFIAEGEEAKVTKLW